MVETWPLLSSRQHAGSCHRCPLDEEESIDERLLRQSAADMNSFTPIGELRPDVPAVPSGSVVVCIPWRLESCTEVQIATSDLQDRGSTFIVMSIGLDVAALVTCILPHDRNRYSSLVRDQSFHVLHFSVEV